MAEYIVTRKASFKFWLVLSVSCGSGFFALVAFIVAAVLDYEIGTVLAMATGVWTTGIASALAIEPEDAVKELRKVIADEPALDEKEVLKRKKYVDKWHRNLARLKTNVDLKASSSNSTTPDRTPSPNIDQDDEQDITTKRALAIGRTVLAALPTSMEALSPEDTSGVKLPEADEK